MSGHGDHDEAHGQDEHEHDDQHDAPPTLEEPATPLWLTLLGIALFLGAGILFVATRGDGKTTAELTAVPASDAAGSAAAAVPDPAAANPAAAAPDALRRPGNAPPNPPGGVVQPAARPQPGQ